MMPETFFDEVNLILNESIGVYCVNFQQAQDFFNYRQLYRFELGNVIPQQNVYIQLQFDNFEINSTTEFFSAFIERLLFNIVKFKVEWVKNNMGEAQRYLREQNPMLIEPYKIWYREDDLESNLTTGVGILKAMSQWIYKNE